MVRPRFFAREVSDPKDIPPPPPPDDFTKTTPNIPVRRDDIPSNDWEKTNYNINIPKASADEWGKTVANIKPIDTSHQSFGGSSGVPSTPEWGMTEPNINVNAADFGSQPEDFAPEPAYDKTTPYFRLPEAERVKYQKLPPTPAEAAAKQAEEEKGNQGIPGWFWFVAGGMTLLFITVIAVALVYIFVIRNSSYEVIVKDAPVGSSVTVDGAPLSVTSEDGTFRIPNLKAGTHTIAVVHPTFNCVKQTVTGDDGEKLKPITAGCTPMKAAATDDCGNIHFGEDDKAERCYNSALDALPDPFTPEDLIKALNILIINFESGKYDIPPVRLAAVKKAAGFIQKLPPGVILEVGGHTDDVGQAASNQTLSENRANAVRDALVKFGVNPAVLQTRGYGSTRPLVQGTTDDARYRNRRIEYSIVKK